MALYFDGQTTLDSEQYDAIAYYRLSKDDGAKRESDSIANQRKLIRSFLQNNPNIHLIEEAQDDGYTGTNFDRPGFRCVLNAIQSKRVNCVIVKDLSRLGREYIETGKYLEMIFPSFGVRFIAINDDVDSENSRAGDDIIIPVINIMIEAYCRFSVAMSSFWVPLPTMGTVNLPMISIILLWTIMQPRLSGAFFH